ncbi:thiosulfate sulfurtransferase 16, chloroplastic-like [Carica papaya]|uniref:thiosulfate sulfurtransferase 16, chloroplastic-like n=1 Tax=Carica papaya TaxID=3649 RepID=UPI000B8D0980|nr:thiosulfate sulfurtransferase 16, chloroplastic-like [Carica papaya]
MEATPLFSSVGLPACSSSSYSSRFQVVGCQDVNLLRKIGGCQGRLRGICSSGRGWKGGAKAAVRRNAEAQGVPTSVPVRVAHELFLAGHRYLDVRTPEEFSAGHASGAINVPYMYRVGSGMTKNTNFLDQVSSHFGKYDEIIVGCQLGKRSLMAAADLLAAGFTSVTDIAGGYAAWTQNGLPTEQ